MTLDPFDSRRDETLGHHLRSQLDPADHAAFAARIRAAIAREPRLVTSWEVLAAWAQPGMVAAAVLAFLLGLWLTAPERPVEMVTTLDEAVQPVDAPVALLGSAEPPTADAMLMAVMEDER